MGALEAFSACVYARVYTTGPGVLLEKHKARRGLGGVVGRSSREEEVLEMRVDSFQRRELLAWTIEDTSSMLTGC